MSNRVKTRPARMGAPWSRECVKHKHRGNRYGGRHERRARRDALTTQRYDRAIVSFAGRGA